MDLKLPEHFSENFLILFVFILIIGGNYLGELLPCKIQWFLNHNIFVKHLFAIITMLLFGILAFPEYKDSGFKTLVPTVTFLYLFFLLISKTHYLFWTFIVTIMFSIYLMSIFRKNNYEKNNKTYKKIKIIEEYASIVIILIALVGFAVYFIEKRREYKGKFSLLTFILGTLNCKKGW